MEPTITDVARHMPACCSTCLSTTGPFADTGVNLGAEGEFAGYGWLYLCVKCVGLLAAVFGFESPEQVAERSTMIASLEEELADVRDALDEARKSRVVPIDQVLAHLEQQRPESPVPPATPAPQAA